MDTYTSLDIKAYMESTGCDLERALYHFEHKCYEATEMYEGDYYEDAGTNSYTIIDRLQYKEGVK
jgi:hypothetical protein